MNADVELEEEQRIRTEEIHFLQNVCTSLQDEGERDRMRRSLVVMLYSHFEGFAKFTFEIYRRAIDTAGLKCCEVQPALASSALRDLFKAFRTTDSAQNFLPRALQGLSDLRPLAIERAFVEKAWDFGQRTAAIPDDFIDLESNLKPVVLRKNLFRLGLPHDLFDSLEGSIHKLLNYRNNIAHGSYLAGISEPVYIELRDAVFRIMDELRVTILASISAQSFRLPIAAPSTPQGGIQPASVAPQPASAP